MRTFCLQWHISDWSVWQEANVTSGPSSQLHRVQAGEGEQVRHCDLQEEGERVQEDTEEAVRGSHGGGHWDKAGIQDYNNYNIKILKY